MSEYYHPDSGKTIKIEPGAIPGGVSTVTESRRISTNPYNERSRGAALC